MIEIKNRHDEELIMKLTHSIDQDIKLNMVFAILSYLLVWFFSYKFFTSHIAHQHPQLLFLLLFIFSICVACKLSRLKLFIPIKAIITMIISFTVSLIIVLFLTKEYWPYVFSLNTVYAIAFAPIGSIEWLKLYFVFPILVTFYLMVLFLLKFKK
ncbi:hypothetical protein ACG95P_02695 [Acinetobacter guillouiae]|uniref:hypothetical protein n=1 Tax=Acinetobacter guillouiae TaxID=106649 RepID=UPI003AF70970